MRLTYLSNEALDKLHNCKESDPVLEGSVLFIQDVLLLLAYKVMIWDGDTGCMLDMLAPWAYIFQGAGHGHYSKELFRL
jgi:hypothetical protein